MTIEEFERQVSIINGKGEWFKVVYKSEYKNKSIELELKRDSFFCECDTFNEAFEIMLNILSLKC